MRERSRHILCGYAVDTGLSRNNFCGYAADAGILSNQSQRIRGGYGTLSNQFPWIRGRCGNALEPVSEDTRRVWESLKNLLSSSAVCARVAGLNSLSHRQRRARILAKFFSAIRIGLARRRRYAVLRSQETDRQTVHFSDRGLG